MKNLSRAIILFFLLLAFSAQAANPLDIVINEVAWMGTKTSPHNEWIELYNNTDKDINLKGWGMYEDGGKILIEPLIGVIKAKSYYIIERTDDTTVPDIPASQEPTGWTGHGLSNKGEHLQLKDNNSAIIDEINCLNKWFAGNDISNQTMERLNSLAVSSAANWENSQNPNGTPKAKNSVIPTIKPLLLPLKESSAQSESKPEPKLSTKPDSNPQKNPEKETSIIAYPSGVIINEILPAPDGPDTEEEWIEIFNQNNFEIDLSNWQITDNIGATKTYTFPQKTKISPQGFLLLKRPISKITLNNGGDSLNLAHPNGNIIDTVNYEKAPRGQSYNRILFSWIWSATLTPDSKNIIPTQEREKTGKETESATAEVKPPQTIDINTAPAKELEKIVGIGPVLAQRIIDARPFYSVNELTKIRGIGPKSLEDIKNQGLAWVDPKLEPPKIEKEIKSSEKGLAAIAEPFKQGGLSDGIPKSLSVLLIALAVAIFSGTIILILKKSLKTKEYYE